MNTIPMHGLHPIMIHLPLIAFAVAIVFDGVDSWRGTSKFRHAAHALWGLAFAGTAFAITTGLLAYGRVDHSEEAHALMTFHRNLALGTTAALIVAAVWRWRRPNSKAASVYSAIAYVGLLWVGYLGGVLVFHNAVGIPTTRLEQIMHERGTDEGHEHGEMKSMKPDSAH